MIPGGDTGVVVLGGGGASACDDMLMILGDDVQATLPSENEIKWNEVTNGMHS